MYFFAIYLLLISTSLANAAPQSLEPITTVKPLYKTSYLTSYPFEEQAPRIAGSGMGFISILHSSNNNDGEGTDDVELNIIVDFLKDIEKPLSNAIEDLVREAETLNGNLDDGESEVPVEDENGN